MRRREAISRWGRSKTGVEMPSLVAVKTQKSVPGAHYFTNQVNISAWETGSAVRSRFLRIFPTEKVTNSVTAGCTDVCRVRKREYWYEVGSPPGALECPGFLQYCDFFGLFPCLALRFTFWYDSRSFWDRGLHHVGCSWCNGARREMIVGDLKIVLCSYLLAVADPGADDVHRELFRELRLSRAAKAVKDRSPGRHACALMIRMSCVRRAIRSTARCSTHCELQSEREQPTSKSRRSRGGCIHLECVVTTPWK